MRAKARFLVATAVVLAVVAVVVALLWLRPRPPAPQGAAGPRAKSKAAVDILRLGSVPVESRDAKLEVRDLKVQDEQGRMEWSFVLVCRETAGCRGEYRVTVLYQSRGRTETLDADRALDLADGGEVRIGRTVRPVQPVDRVERVTVQLLGRAATGGPEPTPIG